MKGHKDLRTQSKFRKLKRVQKVGQSSEGCSWWTWRIKPKNLWTKWRTCKVHVT